MWNLQWASSRRRCAFWPDATPRAASITRARPTCRSGYSGHERRRRRAPLPAGADTAGIMRCLRMLASLALAALLAILPVLGPGPGRVDLRRPCPLALQPHGRLPLQGTPWRLEAYRFRGDRAVARSRGRGAHAAGPGTFDASGGCTRFERPLRGGRQRHPLRAARAQGERLCRADRDGAAGHGRRAAQGRQLRTGPRPGREPAIDSCCLARTAHELLRFGLDDIGALEVGEWRLESYTVDGQRTPADPGQPAVLSFRPDRRNEARRVSSGPASGSTGCNGFVAEFFRRADVMSFGELERTEAPCTPSMAAQEEAMLAVLDATSLRVALTPDQLVLTSSDSGDSLALRPARPLEGSTWLLTNVPGTAAIADPVTLQADRWRRHRRGALRPVFGELRQRRLLHHLRGHRRARATVRAPRSTPRRPSWRPCAPR